MVERESQPQINDPQKLLLLLVGVFTLLLLWFSKDDLSLFTWLLDSLTVMIWFASQSQHSKAALKQQAPQDAFSLSSTQTVKSSNLTGLSKPCLDQLKVGYMVFGNDLKVRECNLQGLATTGISQKITDENTIHDFLACLFEEEALLSKAIFYLENSFGMKALQWKISQVSLPKDGAIHQSGREAYVHVSYIPEFNADDVIESITILVQDMTELKRIEFEAQRRQRDMEKIFSILQVSGSLFDLFMEEARALFEEIKSDLKELSKADPSEAVIICDRMFRSVHTIKANARLFKLHAIQDVAHQVENYLQKIRQGDVVFDKFTIQMLTKRVISISEEIYSYASLRKEVLATVDGRSTQNLKYRVQWIRSLMNQFAMILRDPNFEPRHLKIIQKEFSRALASFDRASLRDYISNYNQMVQDLAMQLGKKVGPIESSLEYHYFDSLSLSRLNDIVVHCIRNAVYHGIEAPEVRAAKGKAEQGIIRLSTIEEDGFVRLVIEDDGKGIDTERLKQKALNAGIIDEDRCASMTEKDAVGLLFSAGLSTAQGTDNVAGRGFGMDIVREYVHSLKGNIDVETKSGAQTRVVLWLPQNQEDFLNPMAIYDLAVVIRNFCADNRLLADFGVPIDCAGDERAIVFADRMTILDVLQSCFDEMASMLPEKARIQLNLSTHLGRRRVDSYNFYRITIKLEDEEKRRLLRFDPVCTSIVHAETVARRNGGSLFVRDDRRVLEINVPSNIPVPFSQYAFQILIFSEDANTLEERVSEFFSHTMGGWQHSIHQHKADQCNVLSNTTPTIVLLDGAYIRTYIDARSEDVRKHDGVILLTSSDLEIDSLDETHVLPENIIFAPPNADEVGFFRSLTAVVMRRFLKEMIREPHLNLDEDSPARRLVS